jgi:3-deoxy-7-phosphoheptulonate synthase
MRGQTVTTDTHGPLSSELCPVPPWPVARPDAGQQPDWGHHPFRQGVCEALVAAGPLVEYADVRTLRRSLAAVAAGEALLLQAGDCAESFEESAPRFTAAKLTALDSLADQLGERAGYPVVRVARIAGQFAKPRSSRVEQCGDHQIPSFRGHLINSEIPTAEARRHDPRRMLRAYEASRTVLASVAALRRSAGAVHDLGPWASHEALVMDYESNLVRNDPDTGDRYLSSAHLPWIGVRTNDPGGAHVRMLAAMRNPVGCKIGPGTDRGYILRLCEALDPEREGGRLVLIARFGRDLVGSGLPPLAKAVRDAGYPVVWLTDPMHGNTVRSASGLKTRRLDDIRHEALTFRRVLERLGIHPGGLHLEVAATPVTECLGGSVHSEDDISLGYTTLCDPRLNLEQAHTLLESWALYRAPAANQAGYYSQRSATSPAR